MGRPSSYSDEAAQEICQRLAGGESLRQICVSEHLPAESTVYLWVANDIEGFSEKYARAREAQQHRYADEIVEIADDGSNDWIEREHESGRVETIPDREHISRSSLRVDTRKWLMARLARRTFGDKIGIDHSGSIKTGDMTDEQVEARIAYLERKARISRPSGEAPKTDD